MEYTVSSHGLLNEGGRETAGTRARTFPSLSHARFLSAEARRPSRPLQTSWSEVFHTSFASVGLGMGWALGVAQTFGAGEGAAFPASLAALCLLLLASLSVVLPLPSPRDFYKFAYNLDSPFSRKMLGLWACTALFAVNTLFSAVFPSAHRFFLALLGIEMLILCPASLLLLAWAHRVEPRPHWESPFLPMYTLLAALSAGSLAFTAYGFLLGGTGKDYIGHLILAGIAVISHALFWNRHLAFVAARGGDGGERLYEPRTAGRLRNVGTLTFLVPLPLVMAGLLVPGPFRFVFLLAPLLATVGILLERVLIYVPENEFPREFPERALREI